jgi:hypothetical protein
VSNRHGTLQTKESDGAEVEGDQIKSDWLIGNRQELVTTYAYEEGVREDQALEEPVDEWSITGRIPKLSQEEWPELPMHSVRNQ